jgi:hypothetical protein
MRVSGLPGYVVHPSAGWGNLTGCSGFLGLTESGLSVKLRTMYFIAHSLASREAIAVSGQAGLPRTAQRMALPVALLHEVASAGFLRGHSSLADPLAGLLVHEAPRVSAP